MRIFIYLIIALCIPSVAFGWGNGPGVSVGAASDACSYSSQDFTDDPPWTEVDAGTYLSVASDTITFTDVNSNDLSKVTKALGADEFTGDFTVRFEAQVSASTSGGAKVLFAVAYDAKGVEEIFEDDTGEAADIVLFLWFNNAGTHEINLRVNEDGSTVDSGPDRWQSAALSTTYYITITRDDDGGTNSTGLYSAVIRETSHTDTIIDTLTANSSTGEQNDFDVLYAFDSWKNSLVRTATGTVSNMEYKLCID